MSISELIKNRLEQSKTRYFACDNISQHISEEEKGLLVVELTEKFEAVLNTLLIDTDRDPNSQDTARRLAKMYIYEIMGGRYEAPPKVTAFPNDGSVYRGMIVIRAEIKSMCSHHHQPVTGVAYIGIIPDKEVLGLSKYIRLAQHHARRGTLQEELTSRIANAVKTAANTENVAVYIEARHGCCENRGVMASSSLTQTTVLSGNFYEQKVKEEFFDQVKLNKMNT
jgi:GTP cyclohydrolase I